MFQRIKGTQDFLDLTLFKFIVDQASKHLALNHFHQIDTPILEPTEMYKRSLGVETDVVSKEMFLIATNPESESICLRPEATASTVRAFVENGIQQVPWKVFSWGPMFRHERPQKGRYRQFHQINIEVIGSAAIAQDAQLISILDKFFSHILMFDSYALAINFLGCSEDRAAFKNTLHEFLVLNRDKICSDCKKRMESNIMRVYDCKTPTCQALYEKDAPRLTDNLCVPCNQEWKQLQDQLEMLSVSFSIKPTLVRGLDYYSKTVFEFVSSNLGAQNAFCGGGRYDKLVSEIGGKEDQPSVGCAIGIERLMLILDPIKDKLPLPVEPTLHVVIPMSQDQHVVALLVAQELTSHGLCADVLLENDSMKSMMRKANKLAAKYALIIGSQEQESKEVTIKDMMTGQEAKVKQIDLVSHLKNTAIPK